MKYEILEHAADLKVRAWGKDEKELFYNMALAIADLQKKDISKFADKEWEDVEISSLDQKSLLIDWLNEILFKSDTNGKVYTDFNIKTLLEKKLIAKIAGQKVSQKQIDIKAATYHNLEIKKTADLWQATVIFDI